MKKLEVIQYQPQDTNFILFYDSQENIEHVNFLQGIDGFKLSDITHFEDKKDKRFYKIFNRLHKTMRLMPALETAWEIFTELFILNELEIESNILENEYLVYHLPPTYEPSMSKQFLTHFTENNGWHEESTEDVVNMCKGDRIDLEDIVIIRTV